MASRTRSDPQTSLTWSRSTNFLNVTFKCSMLRVENKYTCFVWPNCMQAMLWWWEERARNIQDNSTQTVASSREKLLSKPSINIIINPSYAKICHALAQLHYNSAFHQYSNTLTINIHFSWYELERKCKQLAETYITCWMSWLEEVAGTGGRWMRERGYAGSDDDDVGNDDSRYIKSYRRKFQT